MSTDILKAKLDNITRKNKSNTNKAISSVDSFEVKHEAYIRKEYGRFCDQFELYHATISGIFHNLNYGEKGSLGGYKSVQFMIAVNSQKSLYSAYRLFKSGMYDDAMVILRIVYESFLRITFISLNQDYPYNAIIRKSEGPKFNATGLVESQLKLDWTHYSILSNFVHGNSYRIFLDMDANSDDVNPQPVTIRYKIDKDMISICTNYFYFLTLTNLWLAIEQFAPSDEYLANNDALNALYGTAKECKELSYDVLANHTESEYWRAVAVDLAHIFELIAITAKESDRGWKAKWQSIVSD